MAGGDIRPKAARLIDLAERAWHFAKRVAFRLLFVYLVLYNLPEPFGRLPGAWRLAAGYAKFWRALVPWVAAHALHLAGDVIGRQNGSGDTTYAYVRLLCLVLVSAAAAVAWTLVDRPWHHERLNDGLRVYVRYVLACAMLDYGLAKIFKSQFPFPAPDALLESYGESSPMRLLWTFMGFSTAYTFFAGAAEVAGGALLFFRRTTTLGALILVGVLSNVVLLNFCYDVPVKIYSAHLLLMAVFLLAPDLPRLADALVLNRLAAPAAVAPPFARADWNRWGLALKTLFIGFCVALPGVTDSLAMMAEYGGEMVKPELCGAYRVEALAGPGGRELARWDKVAIGNDDVFSVIMKDGSRRYWRMQEDDASRAVKLFPSPRGGPAYVLAYSRPDRDHVILTGRASNRAATLKLGRIDFPLVARGFHWINEFPYNR